MSEAARMFCDNTKSVRTEMFWEKKKEIYEIHTLECSVLEKNSQQNHLPGLKKKDQDDD